MYLRRLRDAAPEFAAATCLAMACPACMTLELAQSCSGYVTTIINNTDVVPTISPGTVSSPEPDHALRGVQLSKHGGTDKFLTQWKAAFIWLSHRPTYAYHGVLLFLRA